jgi:hypothetical protein
MVVSAPVDVGDWGKLPGPASTCGRRSGTQVGAGVQTFNCKRTRCEDRKCYVSYFAWPHSTICHMHPNQMNDRPFALKKVQFKDQDDCFDGNPSVAYILNFSYCQRCARFQQISELATHLRGTHFPDVRVCMMAFRSNC